MGSGLDDQDNHAHVLRLQPPALHQHPPNSPVLLAFPGPYPRPGHVPLLADPAFCDLVHQIGIASLGTDDKAVWHLTKAYW